MMLKMEIQVQIRKTLKEPIKMNYTGSLVSKDPRNLICEGLCEEMRNILKTIGTFSEYFIVLYFLTIVKHGLHVWLKYKGSES